MFASLIKLIRPDGNLYQIHETTTNNRLFHSLRAHSACVSDITTNAMKMKLIQPLKKVELQSGNKISVIGAGAVGMGCVFSLLAGRITNHLCLVDVRKDWCEAERLDLLHASEFINNPCLTRGCDITASKDSRIIVVTAGARPKPGQTRLDVAQVSADIIKSILPQLVECSPNAIYLVASNPADVMTWVAQKVTCLPIERITGPGTNIDSARFRLFIAQRFQVAPSDVNAWIIGEHGGSSVPVWSSAAIGGALMCKLQPKIGSSDDPEKWNSIHACVVNSAYDVIKVKGYTNWAIGLSVADICKAFLENSGRIRPLSTNVKGLYDFKEDVFMAMPCICRGGGIAGIVKLPLSEIEISLLKKSYNTLIDVQKSIKL